MEIVLASASPRRRELLSLITEHLRSALPMRTKPCGMHRSVRKSPVFPASRPRLCRRSTRTPCASARIPWSRSTDCASQAEGRGRGRFHASPSARTHPRGADRTCRAHAGRGAHTLHTCTRVTFRDFAEDELAAYLATGEPLDKAGATASRATAHCSSRASRATITASWVCLWLRFIPFCAIFMRCKPHLPAEIPHFSATL